MYIDIKSKKNKSVSRQHEVEAFGDAISDMVENREVTVFWSTTKTYWRPRFLFSGQKKKPKRFGHGIVEKRGAKGPREMTHFFNSKLDFLHMTFTTGLTCGILILLYFISVFLWVCTLSRFCRITIRCIIVKKAPLYKKAPLLCTLGSIGGGLSYNSKSAAGEFF